MMETIYDKEAMVSKLKNEFATILTYVENAVGHEQIADVEKQVFRQLQHLGLHLVDAFVKQSGTGYQANNPPRSQDGKALEFKGYIESPYFSIFGELKIKRAAYASTANEYFYPLDAQLNLPALKYSYLLDKWILARSAETGHREAVHLLNEVFDFSFFASMPQRLGVKVAKAVDAFYEQSPAPPAESEGSHLAISVDGKGVPLRKSERPAQAPTTATPKARRAKGEKPGIKKQAVVTVDFSFAPGPRTAEDIVKALLKEYTPTEHQQAKIEAQKRRNEGVHEPRVALNKHVRATLQGKDKAMNYLMERLRKRDPAGEKPVIALIDGDLSLEDALERALKAFHFDRRVDAIIVDIIHVSEYVWAVGTALYGEKSDQRVAWVREKLLSILNSEVGRVIGGLKQILTKTELRPAQKQALEKAISYFENHRHMMDYASYLAKGYPIATGLVEGACGSLVKDRMEQSGMLWSIRGAQSVLDLRAVKKNNDWETFWPFYIASEKNRLYADSYRMAA
jgi:hypothetical protein